MAMGVAQTLLQFNAQSRAAKAQGAAVVGEYNAQSSDLARRTDQEMRASAQEMSEAQRRSWQDAALFQATAGEFGAGRSADRAGAVFDVQAGESAATLRENAALRASEATFAGRALHTKARAQLASINRPSVAGTLLQIGGQAAAFAANQHAAAIKPKPKP